MKCMRFHNTIWCVLLVMLAGFVGMPSVARADLQVEVTQALYFLGQDGTVIKVAPGRYVVRPLETSQLELSPAGKLPLVVEAQEGSHDKTITEPEVALLPNPDDPIEVNLGLWLPDGTGLEAVGSTTGVQSRTVRPKRSFFRPRFRFPGFGRNPPPSVKTQQPPHEKTPPPSEDQFITSGATPFTESELINDRIDLNAQRSLLRISKTNRAVDAKLLHGAVNSGALGGIYKADTQVPALRAVRMGTRWFNLIPEGEGSVCLTESTKEDEKPILVFRKSLVEPQTKAAEMDAALLQYRKLCKMSILIVQVISASEPRALIDVENKALKIARVCVVGTTNRCAFALPQKNTYEVTASHGAKRQRMAITLLPNKPVTQIEFNFGLD